IWDWNGGRDRDYLPDCGERLWRLWRRRPSAAGAGGVGAKHDVWRRRRLSAVDRSDLSFENPLQLRCDAERRRLIRAFPGELRLAPAEMAERSRLLVDGPSQVEILD